MASFSPKIEIINHFDELINRLDIDIDESLENYNDHQVFSKLKRHYYYQMQMHKFRIEYFDTIDDSSTQQDQTLGLWSETTKVTDYLKQIRMISLEEFRKAQEDALDNYKSNSSRFKSLLNDKNIQDLSELYPEKMYFQVYFTQPNIKVCAFHLFTFVIDFYMSPSDIDLLE